ncbi:MAG: energy transducer TonB [Pseudomonadota bacterium]
MLSNRFPLPRFTLSTALGALVTATLLWLMQDLIRHDGPVPDPADPTPNLTIVRLPEPEPFLPVEPPVVPPVVDPPPTVIDRDFDVDFDDRGSYGVVAPEVITKPVIHGGAMPDGDMLPIVKVRPVYPNRAITRGIEGWVLLTFTVDESGAVRDPKVIDASPVGIFDREALRAVLRFKYKPRVFNGAPVAVEKVHHRLVFELAES